MDAALQTLANCAAARLREVGIHPSKLAGLSGDIPPKDTLSLVDAVSHTADFVFRGRPHSYRLVIPKPRATVDQHLANLGHWLNHADDLLGPGAPLQALQEITGLPPVTLRKRYAFEPGAAMRVHARDLIVFSAASLSRLLQDPRWVPDTYQLVLQGRVPETGEMIEIGLHKTELILPKTCRVPVTFSQYCRYRPAATQAPKKPRDVWAKTYTWLTEHSPIRNDIEPELLEAVKILAASAFPKKGSRKLDVPSRIGPRLRQY